MTRSERASQIWPILSLCAKYRQTLTYELLGKLIGVPHNGLGQLLEPIQSYCIIKKLPPLTCLIVGVHSGSPGEGFIASENLPQAQALVFKYPWIDNFPPKTDDLEIAVQQLPSNGKSLIDLKKSLSLLSLP